MESKYRLYYFDRYVRLPFNCVVERTVLWYLTFWGFAINYMFRMNINIAIVSMIKHPKTSTNITYVRECPSNVVPPKTNNSFTYKLSADQDVNINYFFSAVAYFLAKG